MVNFNCSITYNCDYIHYYNCACWSHNDLAPGINVASGFTALISIIGGVGVVGFPLTIFILSGLVHMFVSFIIDRKVNRLGGNDLSLWTYLFGYPGALISARRKPVKKKIK